MLHICLVKDVFMFYMSPLIIALHQGYLQFTTATRLEIETIFLVGRDICGHFVLTGRGGEVPICGTVISSDAVAHLVTSITNESSKRRGKQ